MPFIADKKQSPRESNVNNVMSIQNKLKTGFDKRMISRTTKSRHIDLHLWLFSAFIGTTQPSIATKTQ